MIEAARGTQRAALNHAVSEELILGNVAGLVTLPKVWAQEEPAQELVDSE